MNRTDLSTIKVTNSATNEIIATFPDGGGTDTANDAFRSWSNYSVNEQSDIIRTGHDLINEHYDNLAKTIKRGHL